MKLKNLSEIDKQAHRACTSPLNDLPLPTQEQKENGDYVKGSVSLLGLNIAIENPTGSTRSGVDPNGTSWSIDMKHHYGYIENTKGADGEEVDVFIKNGLEDFNGDIFVIYQIHPHNGEFDEHKVIIGADSAKEARSIYLSNYKEGWDGIGKMVKYSIPTFKNKFLNTVGVETSRVVVTMSDNKLTLAAVKVAAEKFTWMKYKGTNAKILKHEKRNGDIIRTRLEIGDVYGYREVKQRSTGKHLVQVVLKSDGMDLAYNISPKTFNSMFLKVSRATVIPKAFKTKPVVVDAIDKKAKPTEQPKEKPKSETPILNTQPKFWMTENKKLLGIKELDSLNGLAVNKAVADAVQGVDAQLRVQKVKGVPTIYLIIYDARIIGNYNLEGIEKLLSNTGASGLYQDVTATATSTITYHLQSKHGLNNVYVGAASHPVRLIKSKAHPGHNYLKILMGTISLGDNKSDPIPPKESTSKDVEKDMQDTVDTKAPAIESDNSFIYKGAERSLNFTSGKDFVLYPGVTKISYEQLTRVKLLVTMTNPGGVVARTKVDAEGFERIFKADASSSANETPIGRGVKITSLADSKFWNRLFSNSLFKDLMLLLDKTGIKGTGTVIGDRGIGIYAPRDNVEEVQELIHSAGAIHRKIQEILTFVQKEFDINKIPLTAELINFVEKPTKAKPDIYFLGYRFK